jgi:hypothetical protein
MGRAHNMREEYEKFVGFTMSMEKLIQSTPFCPLVKVQLYLLVTTTPKAHKVCRSRSIQYMQVGGYLCPPVALPQG